MFIWILSIFLKSFLITQVLLLRVFYSRVFTRDKNVLLKIQPIAGCQSYGWFSSVSVIASDGRCVLLSLVKDHLIFGGWIGTKLFYFLFVVLSFFLSKGSESSLTIFKLYIFIWCRISDLKGYFKSLFSFFSSPTHSYQYQKFNGPLPYSKRRKCNLAQYVMCFLEYFISGKNVIFTFGTFC